MATLMVRQIDDRDYTLLTEAARANGRSIAAEVRDAIAERARKQRALATVERLRQLAANSAHCWEEGVDSVALIRAIRDEE